MMRDSQLDIEPLIASDLHLRWRCPWDGAQLIFVRSKLTICRILAWIGTFVIEEFDEVVV